MAKERFALGDWTNPLQVCRRRRHLLDCGIRRLGRDGLMPGTVYAYLMIRVTLFASELLMMRSLGRRSRQQTTSPLSQAVQSPNWLGESSG